MESIVPMGGRAEPGAHEWHRFRVGWHAVFAGVAVLVAVLVSFDDQVGSSRRSVALVLIGVLGGWYSAVGRPALDPSRRLGDLPPFGRAARSAGSSRAAWLYLAVAVPLCLVLIAVAPAGAMLLFVLYPQVWAMLPVRSAVWVTVALVAAVSATIVVSAGATGSDLASWLVLGLVSLALALMLGLWIARVVSQSQQRAQLIRDLAEARDELARANREAGMLAERQRLAHDIHDTLAQGFASVLLLLEAADATVDGESGAARVRAHLDRARLTARENLEEARAMVAALTPPALGHTSLPEALRRIVQRGASAPQSTMDDRQCCLHVTGVQRALPPDHEVAILRIVQEALTNVHRHSGAGRVDVTLAYEPSSVSCEIRDDGAGFAPGKEMQGYGLAAMSARAGRVGGALAIDTAPGAGVTVRLEIATKESKEHDFDPDRG